MPIRPGLASLPLAASIASVVLGSGCNWSAAKYDLIVRGGTVVDGTGAPPRRADVAILGDRIVAVENLDGQRAKVEIDATAHVVAPGFIDTQGQSGRAALLDGALESHLRQGITSEIIGEASTPALWRADGEDVEGLRRRGVPHDWSGFSGFLATLGRRGLSLNLGSLVPFNQVRANVVGMDNRPPTAAELDGMREVVAESMQQGALGLSTALIYPPGSFAATAEIVDLARVAAAHGGIYVSHIRGETDRLPVALDEAISVGREARIPVVVFHLKVASRARWGSMRTHVETIRRARAEGLEVSATQYPYTVAGTGLDACLPDWVLEGGRTEALRRLARPAVRTRVRREITNGHEGWENFLKSAGFDGVTIVGVRADGDASTVGHTLAEIAASRGHDPWRVFFDLLLEHRLQVSALYALMTEEDVRVAMRQPWVSFGSDSTAQSDDAGQAGRPHPRGFGTFPRVLGRYVREDAVLSLQEAVHKMTGLSARQMGIAERGELRPGYFADVVVFDPMTVADRATFDAPRQYPVGIATVVVNGVLALADGRPTGARAGRALKKVATDAATAAHRELGTR